MDYRKPFDQNCQNRAAASHASSCPHADNTECGCEGYEMEDALSGMPPAMAYVPWQRWRNVYDAQSGLEKGTIFGELIFPFLYASPVCRECGCHTGKRGDFR